MGVRCLLVDDEELARRQLARLLGAHPDFEIAGEAANGVEALERIEELRPEVVFLDIEMPGLSGFDVLAQLANAPLIVFATAFDEYAIRAFEANAIDYLLKPIQPARLEQTAARIRERVAEPRAEYDAALKQAVATLHPGPPAKIAGKRGKRIVLLSPQEIVLAAVEEKLVFLHTQTDRFITDRTIAELEELLGPAGFFRVSRSALVNLEQARELLPWFSGTWRVKLSNGAELDVSRERSRELKRRIG